MFKKILIPLDGSELAERALEPAMRVAKYYQSEVTLLQAPVSQEHMTYDPVGYGWIWSDQALEGARDDAAAYLDKVRQRYAAAGLVIKLHIENGDEAGIIVDYATEQDIDLIVMSTHGYSGLTRWVLGSVTEKVLRSAPCPVWVIRQTEPARRVLITLDGSKIAEEALTPALSLAEAHQAEATLLRVVPPLIVDSFTTSMLAVIEHGLDQQLLEEARREAQLYLKETAQQIDSAGASVNQVVLDGLAAPSILAYCEEQEIDLVAMATHGRSGFQRWVYGSITEKVLRGSQASMLIIRPAQEDDE